MDQNAIPKDRVREKWVEVAKAHLMRKNPPPTVDGICEVVAQDLGVPVEWVRYVIQPQEQEA